MTKLYAKMRESARRNRVRLACAGVVTALLVLFLWPSIVISIRPGEMGVLYSRLGGGTVRNETYDEGIHLILPWDIMYIYDVRVQEESRNIEVLTVDGLTINTQISLRFQIIRDKLPALHQDIGPNFRDKVVIPIMNSAVRQTIGSYRPDDLYSTARQKLQDQMLVDAIEEMGRIPILIQGFVVKSITLPQILSEAIETKLVAEQNFLRYKYILMEAEQEARRKVIEGEGIQAYQVLVNKNMTPNYLRYEGIRATRELASSPNAKMVVIGGKDGLPIILNGGDMPQGSSAAPGPQALAPSSAPTQTPTSMQAATSQQNAGSDKAATATDGTLGAADPGSERKDRGGDAKADRASAKSGRASRSAPPPGQAEAAPPPPADTGLSWIGPNESVGDFLRRLDKVSLNPHRARTPEQ